MVDTGAESLWGPLLSQPLLSHNRVINVQSKLMTSPHHEVPVLGSLLPRGGSCLQAVSLFTVPSWFILTTAHEGERSTSFQTTLVSLASTLREVFERLVCGSVVGPQWGSSTGDGVLRMSVKCGLLRSVRRPRRGRSYSRSQQWSGLWMNEVLILPFSGLAKTTRCHKNLEPAFKTRFLIDKMIASYCFLMSGNFVK